MDGPLCGQPGNPHWSRLTATGVSNALPLSEEAVTTISRISPSKTFLQETYTLPSGPAAIAVLQQGQALSAGLIFFSNVLPPSRDRVKDAVRPGLSPAHDRRLRGLDRGDVGPGKT